MKNIFRKTRFDLSTVPKITLSMLSPTKLKCPKCSRHVLKQVVLMTNGKCNNCGYKITGALTSFAPIKGAFDPMQISV